MQKDLSLKGKLAAGAAACLLLAVAMWAVLYVSNGRVETRLESGMPDPTRVSGRRSRISLTEKITGPVLNAADYGSDVTEKEGEFNAASASATKAIASLEELFTAEEATSTGYEAVRDSLLGVKKDAARILAILKDPKARKTKEVE